MCVRETGRGGGGGKESVRGEEAGGWTHQHNIPL